MFLITKKNRKIHALTFILLLCLTSGVGNIPNAKAVDPPINTDLGSYVLFAIEEFSYKGGNDGAGLTGFVLGGNVGVNNYDPNLGDTNPIMNVGANGVFAMSPDTQLIADSMRLGEEAVVNDVFRNREFGTGWNFPGTVYQNIYNFTTPPIIKPFSLMTSDSNSAQNDIAVADATGFTVGMRVIVLDRSNTERNQIASISGNTLTMVNPLANDYELAKNGAVEKDPFDSDLLDCYLGKFTASSLEDDDITVVSSSPGAQQILTGSFLPPGTYRDLRVQDGNTLHLGAGVYTLRRFNTGRNVLVYTVPGTILQVTGDTDPNSLDWNLGVGSFFGPENADDVRDDPDYRVPCICFLGDDFNFGRSGEFWGVVKAPYADIALGFGFTHYGRFYSRKIHSDFNDNIYARNCPEEVAPAPALDVEKYVSVNDQATWHDADTPTGPETNTGNDVYFEFIITNIGNVELSNLELDDDIYDFSTVTIVSVERNDVTYTDYDASSGDILFDDTLDTGDTYKVIIGPVPAMAGEQTDTATANAEYDTDPLSDADDANYFGTTGLITVKKYVSVDDQATWDDADTPLGSWTETGNDVYFKFVIANIGNVPLSSVTLSDSDYSFDTYTPSTTEAYTLSADDIVFDDPLEESESYTVIIGPVTSLEGQQTNTAEADGTYNDDTYCDMDDANYFGITLLIDVEKYVSVDEQANWFDADDPTGPSALIGADVYFKFVIKNTGNTPLADVRLEDNIYDFGAVTIDYAEYYRDWNAMTYPLTLTSNYTIDAGKISFERTLDLMDSYTVVIGPIPAQEGQNTNTATGTGVSYLLDEEVTDSDDANYVGTPSEPEFLYELKALALDMVSEIDTGIYRLDYKNSLVVSYITKSINPALWVDLEHIDPVMGWLVFKYEFMACNHMKLLMADYPDEPVVDVYMEVCGLLVEADRQLAKVLMDEAMALAPPEGTPERSVYDTYFAKATMYYEQGLAYMESGDCCRAILQFEYSWLQSKTIVQRFS